MNDQRPPGPPSFEKRYAVLVDISRILTGTRRLEDLYRSLYEQASRVLETTGFYISLYDADTDEATAVFYADRGRIQQVRQTYRGSDSRPIREARPFIQQVKELEDAVMLLGEEDDGEVTRSSVAAPMIRDGRVVGVISAQSYRPGAYEASDLELLSALADIAAVVLENVRYVAETERRRREAERLEEIGRAITASLELGDVLERVIAASLDLGEAESAGVFLWTDEQAAEVAATGGEIGLAPGTRFAVPEPVLEQLVARREILIVHDEQATQLLDADLRSRLGVESLIAAPLVAEDRVIGALGLGHRRDRNYGDEDIRIVERLAYQTAIAVQNARLHDQIRTLSLTDPLTELPNRRHLELVLEREFAAARRGRPLAVLLFDLDNFKGYNDDAGHQAGDEALRRFAGILAEETRAMNLAARYGGDEFITVLSQSTGEGALVLADRIASRMADDTLLGAIGLRASVGVAAYSPEMTGPHDLISAADRDLFRRKARRERGEVTAT